MNLKEHLDANDVLESIRLELRHPSGTAKVWVIVEGETDQRLFVKLLDGKNIEIEFVNGGVEKFLYCVSELLKETDRIIGIRDADFINLEGKENTTPKNIFLTDYHDAEMMLISCNKAYKSVAAEYLDKEKQPPLRDNILKSISFIAGLRWINDTDNLELNFKGIGFGNFYDGKAVELNEDKCIEHVIKRSKNKKKNVSKKDIRSKIKNVSDYFNLCNGHDFQKAFAFCVSSYLKKGVNDIQIGKAFRVAYRFEDFKETNLYRQLKSWAKSNSVVLFKN